MGRWNKNDWQGKRKEQVDYDTKSLFFGTITLIVIIIISVVSSYLK
jgi:uncharacterized membrane protein YidH (DUF202 family)